MRYHVLYGQDEESYKDYLNGFNVKEAIVEADSAEAAEIRLSNHRDVAWVGDATELAHQSWTDVAGFARHQHLLYLI